ncbi:MAG TPA: hypothetical protein VKE51_11695 [Vicinamibacterales bacterium]|nr:hypothetical protein [Vicinamibacterales bacterium]
MALTVGGEIRLHGQAAFAGVETPIVVARGKQTDTAIDGTVVVWTDTSSGNADISYSDGIVHAAIVKPGDQHLSAVSGTTIAYTNQTQADPRPDLHVRYSNGHSHAHQQ